MSIWCSHEPIGFDRNRRRPRGGQVRSYATGWSNHYPTVDGKVERKAMLDLASIAPWCVTGQDDYEESPEYDIHACGPWLRLCVLSSEHNYREPAEVLGTESASVVMDEGAVRELVAQLSAWLERPKVYPVKAANP